MVAAPGRRAAHPVVLTGRGRRGPRRPPPGTAGADAPPRPGRTGPRRLVLPGAGPLPEGTRALRAAPARRPGGTGAPRVRPALPRVAGPGTGCLRPRCARLLRLRPLLRRRGSGPGPVRRDRGRRRLRGARRRRGPGRPAPAGRDGPLLRRLPGDGLPRLAPGAVPHRRPGVRHVELRDVLRGHRAMARPVGRAQVRAPGTGPGTAARAVADEPRRRAARAGAGRARRARHQCAARRVRAVRAGGPGARSGRGTPRPARRGPRLPALGQPPRLPQGRRRLDPALSDRLTPGPPSRGRAPFPARRGGVRRGGVRLTRPWTRLCRRAPARGCAGRAGRRRRGPAAGRGATAGR
ncbi:hypothetical protein SGPA1_21780 [Streptomyces misionensis JCM 4497]